MNIRTRSEIQPVPPNQKTKRRIKPFSKNRKIIQRHLSFPSSPPSPSVFDSDMNECQQLLQELKNIQAQKRATREAHQLHVRNEAHKVIVVMVINYRLRKRTRIEHERLHIIKLQSQARGFLCRVNYKRYRSARKLESIFRGIQARKDTHVLRRTKVGGALVIQCQWRCWMAYKIKSTLLPFPVRIKLYHNRRMAQIRLAKWWKSRRWELVHSTEYRKKVQRMKAKKKKRRGNYGARRRKNQKKKATQPSPPPIAKKVMVPTKTAAAATAATAAAVAPTQTIAAATTMATAARTATASPASPASPAASPASAVTKTPAATPPTIKDDGSWKFAPFPTDSELHVNHDRAIFQQNREAVGKILSKYDREVRAREECSGNAVV